MRAAAERLVAASRQSIAERGSFRIVLAGGSTPKALYELLASPSFRERVDWGNWHVYFGDERAVSPRSKESNYRMAREALFDRTPIPKEQIHRIPAELGPSRATRLYEKRLAGRRFDFVLLGMGADGHTASLFPSDPKGLSAPSDVVATTSPAGPNGRVTLTLSALRRADRIAFLVTGESKAQRLRQVLDQVRSGQRGLPAARVRPASGSVEWFVDRAAAGELR